MKRITEEQLSKRMTEFLKIDPRDHLVSAVLTEKQWEVFHELQRALRPNHGLFAGASLSDDSIGRLICFMIIYYG